LRLATEHEHDTYDRLLLFTNPTYEYPRLVSSRLLFEAYASPLARDLALETRRPVDLAFHDA